MQLSLLNSKGADSGQTVTFDWFPVELVKPSDDNPRLSLKEDVVIGLTEVLGSEGWAKVQPIAVRPVDSGYEVVDGHHRLEAAIRAGCASVLCVVHEIDDSEAVVQRWLLNQQTEFADIEKCLYFWKHTQKDSKTGLSRAAFARRLKLGETRGRHLADAGEVAKQSAVNCGLLSGKSSHLAVIHKAPIDDWTWLVQSLLTSEWSVKQTESVVKAIAGLTVDPRLNDWLKPEQYKKQAVKEASQGQASDIVSRVSRWSKTAVESLESLDDSRPAWLFSDSGEPYREIISPKALFLERLQGIGTPSDKKILNVKSQVLAYLDELDREYAHWEEQQRDATAAQRAAEAEERRIAQLKERYTPEGINADLREVEIEKGTIDAVITDPPYLLSNGGFTLRSGKEAPVDKNFEDSEQDAIAPEEWLPIVADWLKPGGVLIATCTLHIYHRLWNAAQACGFDVAREQAIWYKRNSPPQLSPDRLQPDFEYIFIAFKPGEKYYFGYEDYRQSYGSQPSRLFDIPQCSGKERLGWHDTQKPIELSNKLIALYCPEDGIVLDPFAGSGTFAASAKGLKRRAIWIEQDAGHFSKAENRIAIAPFAWEIGS